MTTSPIPESHIFKSSLTPHSLFELIDGLGPLKNIFDINTFELIDGFLELSIWNLVEIENLPELYTVKAGLKFRTRNMGLKLFETHV